MPTDDVFADVLAANESYAASFDSTPLEGRAARGLGVVTCIDSRIDPLAMLGLARGDAKIVRTAGARVSDDVVATLVLGSWLLGIERVMVVAHTQCRMARGPEPEIHAAIAAAGGPDTSELSFPATADQEASLREDVDRIRSSPYLKPLEVGGFIYDVTTGRLRRVT